MNSFPITANHYLSAMHADTFVEVPLSRIPRKEAFNLLEGIFSRLAEKKLAGSHYLAFGSVAKELLDPRDATDFGDLDILTIRPLPMAIDDIKWVLRSLEIGHEDLEDGSLILAHGGQQVQLQLIDLEYSKKAYPGGFIAFKDAVFDSERCVQYPKAGPCEDVPCVPQAFIDTYGKVFYYKGDVKVDPGFENDGESVSEFSLDF
jgi:hypothetical protein